MAASASRAARDVLIHYHVFKNAGLSVDLCLEEAFGRAWSVYNRVGAVWTADANITGAELLGHLQEHTALRAITSSTARWPEPSTEELATFPIVFLRHPIDRVGSIFAHRRQASRPELGRLTFPEFVDWMLAPNGSFMGRSFHTLFLSDDIRLTESPGEAVSEATAWHLASATDRLERLPVFGVLERFGDSIRQITECLASRFPELVWRPHHVNWSGRQRDLEQRVEDIAGALGASRYRRLVAANEADLELYARASALFESRTRA